MGTSSAQGSIAPLIAGLIEDVTERARERVQSPGGRCEPPLSLVLDEAANIAPLPTLPTLLGRRRIGDLDDGDLAIHGTGPRTVGYRRVRRDAEASTFKAVLGGSTSASDLEDISNLAGEIDEEVHTVSYNPARGDSMLAGDANVTMRKVRGGPSRNYALSPKATPCYSPDLPDRSKSCGGAGGTTPTLNRYGPLWDPQTATGAHNEPLPDRRRPGRVRAVIAAEHPNGDLDLWLLCACVHTTAADALANRHRAITPRPIDRSSRRRRRSGQYRRVRRRR